MWRNIEGVIAASYRRQHESGVIGINQQHISVSGMKIAKMA